MMKHSEFTIGQNFECGGRQWRCSDIGTRVIVAIPIDFTNITTTNNKQSKSETRVLTEKDLTGPPYWLAETVFDEDDILSCTPL